MTTKTEAAEPTLKQLQELHGNGQYLDAYELSKPMGPIKTWTDPAFQLIGGRLAHNLGSHRLGRMMHRAAHRQLPDDPEAIYFYTVSMIGRWSPLETWERVQARGELKGANLTTQADWETVKGQTLALLRDFERAEECFDRAIQLQPERSWLHVCRTSLLESQDRPDEAMECAEHAFELSPWYRPAVQNLGHMLVQKHRDDEALSLMREGIDRIQSGSLRAQLAALYLELEMYDEARQVYQSLAKYHPLQHYDRKAAEWHAARLADAAYYCGDFAAVPAHAEETDSDFYRTLAKNVQEKKDGKRVNLPVNFVRQNHMTCAPATLSAISEYWEKPAEHLEIVEEICYDGTPAHNERRWAERSGFAVREFRVTLENARQLVDRGCPFTLTTVNPGSAHLQAVIGYDSYRESLIIRDPGERHFAEFEIQQMLKHYAANGPRGMVLVPKEKAELLDGIHFDEAELYDQCHKVELALEKHDRDEAVRVLDAMKSAEADHRLTLQARTSLAAYDGNTRALLAVANAKLKQFPDDVNTKLSKLGCLGELGENKEKRELLKSLIDEKDCNPLFWGRYAAELCNDAREHEEAMRHLRKLVRYRPHDMHAYGMMALILMDQEKQDEAFELYRFAACIGDMSEGPARSYFSASRVVNKQNTVLRFLKDRFDRFAKQSSYPTRTLAWAFNEVDRTDDSFQVLKRGLKLRPDDGELLLYYSDFCGRYGKRDDAAKLLELAKEKSHKTMWNRTAGLQRLYQGESAAALPFFREVIEAEPLDAGGHRFIAEITADLEGDQAAIEYLRGVVNRFEHSVALRTLLIEWLRADEPAEFAEQLNQSIELNPNDAWGIRELAFLELKDRKFERAVNFANRAKEIEPYHPAADYVLGRAALSQNKTEEAKEHFRDAIRISIDYDFAIGALISCCHTKAERVAELEFIYQQMTSQVNFGDGLLSFAAQGADSLDAETLLKRLRAIHAKRPDLWQSWSAVSRKLTEMQKHDEAIAVAKKATERFPLLPRTWIDLAQARSACGEIDGEIAALKRALEINSSWGEPSRCLAEAYEKKGELDLARQEVERMLVAEPRDVRNLGFLASLQWSQDQKHDAIGTVVKAVQMQPGYSWGWTALRSWGAHLKQNELVVDISRQLTEKRPQDYRSWLIYARSLGERDQIDEACAALDKAIGINPTNSEAYNQKAFQLSRAGRFDEALTATRPKAFGKKIPLDLRARAAWIECERGNIETAVTMMEKVIEADRDYYWAWVQLADWYNFQQRNDKYLDASNELVRIAPLDSTARGYLGDAELRHDRKAKAKKHFLQAVQLAPDYNFGATRLFDLQLEDEEYDEALGTLEIIAPHIAPAWLLAEKVRVESLRKNQDVALDLLKQLAVTESNDSKPIDSAVESLFKADWGDAALPALDKLLEEPNAQKGVAYVFVHLSATMRRWEGCHRRMDWLLKNRPELWKEGAKKLVVEYAACDAPDRLPGFVAQHRERLHEDVDLWDAVGEAYNAAGNYDQTLKWMQNWRKRKGLRMEMAYTIATANWELKQPHKAVQPSRHAFEQLEPDDTIETHLTLIAFYELNYGSIENCVDAVSMVDPNQLGGLYNLLFQYVVTALENLSQGGTYAQLASQLKEIHESLPENIQELVFPAWIHALCQWRAAALHGKRFKAFMLKRKL